MTTKILGHRIGDKIIDKKHLSDLLVLNEGEQYLHLNYHTHSNANDLSSSEKSVLTKNGNADALHFHTGGGGGAEGIYTHQQIDSALLQIMMQLNSMRYSMYHSIMDGFDDDTGIYYGITAPTINSSIEITSPTGSTSLDASSTYYYQLACKNKGGISNSSLPFKVQTVTDSSVYHSIRLSCTINPDNEGVTLWRTKSATISKEVPFDRYTSLYSPQGLTASITSPDRSFNGMQGIDISYIGSSARDNMDIDVLATINGGLVTGDTMSVPILDNMRPVFCTTTPLTHDVSLIKIAWSANPAYIPLDYTIEYSQILNPDKANNSHWQKFTDIDKVYYDEATQVYTDGNIANSAVTGNTKVNNHFVFAKRRVTGVRLTITKMVAGVQLIGLSAIYTSISNGEYVIHQFPDEHFDITSYKTVMLDMISDENPSKMSLTVMPTTTLDTAIVSNTTVYSNLGNNSTISGNPVRLYRSRMYMQGNRTDAGYNRIRLKFSKPANQRLRITNITVGLSPSNTADILPATLSKVTFGGLDFYDIHDATTTFESDWIPLTLGASYAYVMVSLCVEVGSMYFHSYNSNHTTWYIDNNIGMAYDTVATTAWTAYQANYCLPYAFEIAKTTGKNMRFDTLPNKGNTPHTQILDISGINSDITSLRGMAYHIESVTNSGDMQVSNIRFNNVIDISKDPGTTLTASSTLASSNVANIKNDSIASFWESNNIPTVLAGESVMLKFATPSPISRIRICEDESSPDYTLESYTIQFSVSDSALVTDDTLSTNWINVTNLNIDKATALGFTGSITAGKVSNNNIHRAFIDNVFDETIAKAVRIVFHKTRGNTSVRLYQARVFTSDSQSDYVLVKDIATKQPSTLEIIDEGINGKVAVPNKINTTGTYNITFDKAKGCIGVLDKTKEGVFVSNAVHTDPFLRYIIGVQQVNKNNSKYYISSDDGYTWTEITLDTVGMLAVNTPATNFRLKAILKGEDILSAYSALYSL